VKSGHPTAGLMVALGTGAKVNKAWLIDDANQTWLF
jgi:hypothetical protein